MYGEMNSRLFETRRKEKTIFYCHVIGSNADVIFNQIMDRLSLTDPRVRKTNYGSLKVTGYSFKLNDTLTMDMIRESIKRIVINEFCDEVQVLYQNRNNLYIMNPIKYF